MLRLQLFRFQIPFYNPNIVCVVFKYVGTLIIADEYHLMIARASELRFGMSRWRLMTQPMFYSITQEPFGLFINKIDDAHNGEHNGMLRSGSVLAWSFVFWIIV